MHRDREQGQKPPRREPWAQEEQEAGQAAAEEHRVQGVQEARQVRRE